MKTGKGFYIGLGLQEYERHLFRVQSVVDGCSYPT